MSGQGERGQIDERPQIDLASAATLKLIVMKLRPNIVCH